MNLLDVAAAFMLVRTLPIKTKVDPSTATHTCSLLFWRRALVLRMLTKSGTVLPRTYAHAFIKDVASTRTDAHVLLFEYVRLLLNCLRCNLVVCV